MGTPENAAVIRAHLREHPGSPAEPVVERVVAQTAALLGEGEVTHVDSSFSTHGASTGHLVAFTASRAATVDVTRAEGSVRVRATGFARSSLTTLTTTSDAADEVADGPAAGAPDPASWPAGQTLTATYWEVERPLVLPLSRPLTPPVAEATARLFTSLLADLSDH